MSGQAGDEGVAGDTGGACGSVEVREKVTVIAHGGAAGVNGAGGAKTNWRPYEGPTYYWAAYGGGYKGTGGTVAISGGSIKASSIQSQPKNVANAPVYCVTAPGTTSPCAITGLGDYGTKGIVPIDGKVYLYLPNGTYTFTVDGVKYRAVVNGAATTAGLYPTCEGGEIVEGDGGEWIVTPSAGASEVTVANLPAGAVVAVPPSVTKVSGVADGQIKVKSGAYDITGAFTVSGGAIALGENGSVTIGDETIPVKPVIGDLDEGEPFVVGDTVAVTIRAIPGLKYVLVRGTRIGSGGIIDPALPTDPVVATGTRVTLEDTEHPTDKAFYLVEVLMP